LQLEYANKKIKFEDLKYNQFVADEMEIIIACKNDKEKTGRLRLLKKISYYYELYDWKALLQYYAAWIRRVNLALHEAAVCCLSTNNLHKYVSHA
jgi:hypothetical protein